MSRRSFSRFRFLGSRLAALVVVSLLALPAAGASASGQTVISLTFDNGLASQYGVRAMLSSHGMHGTFYINSDLAGSNSYYMSWSQISDLASDGNEIGGQTLDNENLTSVSTTEAQHQVCDDRSALISHGFSASSFAYPYGATNATVEGIVKNCGYVSARRQGGIFDPNECNGCAYANAIPPADAYNVKGSEWLPQAYALSDLEGWVSRAQANGGGWVPIVFDDICNSCGASSVSTATLQSFLDWLGQQQNTVVETIRHVMPPADTTPPQTTIACNGGSCSGTFKNSVSVSLSATDSGSGVSSTHYTTDGSVPTLQSPTYTGPFNVTKQTTISFRSWDTSGNVEAMQSQPINVSSALVVSLSFDDGIATQYQVRSWLASHGMHATFFINSDNVGANSYYMTWPQIHDIASDGNEIGGHTLDHLDLTSLSTADATHQVCDDRTNLINQGFQVSSFAYPFSKSNATVIGIVQQCGYSVARLIGGLNDPSDCPNCPYAENIPPANAYQVQTPEWFARPWTLADLQGWITQAETHGGGWVPLVFHDICDGCANGSISASDLQAFLDWLQTRPNDVVETIRQVVPPGTQNTSPPVTTIACNSASCGGWYRGSVSVALSATDPSSPVTSTHYTTDGSDPTLSSPTYTAPFAVSATTTVKFRSWDANGDVEATNTQQIQVDSTAPSTTITCGGSGCTTGWYKSGVSIALNASDGGSGVSSTHYTTDGSTPSLSSPTYSAAFTLTVPATGTVTVKFRSWDVAGNVEATHSQQVRVDATAPTSKILCGGSTCSSTAFYSRKTKFTLSASDTGSGVGSIHYTKDGSTPTLSSPTYTGGFTLPSGTTTITFGAWDKVGNVESPHAQVIHVS
jgi:peptidoglycan/xylan/chitin deacetylase (PgdA/CDA1 family)